MTHLYDISSNCVVYAAADKRYKMLITNPGNGQTLEAFLSVFTSQGWVIFHSERKEVSVSNLEKEKSSFKDHLLSICIMFHDG